MHAATLYGIPYHEWRYQEILETGWLDGKTKVGALQEISEQVRRRIAWRDLYDPEREYWALTYRP